MDGHDEIKADPTGYEPGKGDAYEYIPSWMAVPPLYSTEQTADPLAVVKLFTPDSSWSWYILEYDGQDTCFGLVQGFETELGYFSLSEIEDVTGPLGLRIERDLWFRPTPVTQLAEYQAKWPAGGPYQGTPPEPETPAQAGAEAAPTATTDSEPVQAKPKRKLPDDIPDVIEVDRGRRGGWARATALRVSGRWLHYRFQDAEDTGKVQVIGRDIVWRVPARGEVSDA